MKKYSEIVNKQFKVNKKSSILSMFGIMVGIVMLIAVSVFFQYMKERDLAEIKNRIGNYEASYYIDSSNNKNKIDILKNSTLVKDFYISGEETTSSTTINGVNQTVILEKVPKETMDNVFKDRLINNLKTGRLPSNDNEVIVDENFLALGGKLSDKININGKDYLVVGTYFEQFRETNKVTAVSGYNYSANDDVIVYVNLNTNKKNISQDFDELMMKLDLKREKISYNSELINNLYSTSVGNIYIQKDNANMNEITRIIIILISIISSYGIISFKMSNKVKQFGILRCIGATPKQIRALVYKEIMIIVGVAIIPAIIIGYGIAFIAIKALTYNNFMDAYGIKFSVYPNIIMEVLIISIIIISLAVFNPARKAGLITPLEGIKNNIKTKEKFKRRKSKLIRKFFGIEGEIAYKNLRAKPNIFWTSTILLSLTFIAVVVIAFSANNHVKNLENDSRYSKEFVVSIGTNPKIEGKEEIDYTDEDWRQINKSYNEKLFYKGLESKKGIENILRENGVTDIAYSGILGGKRTIFINGTKGIKDVLKNSTTYEEEPKEIKKSDGTVEVFEDIGMVYIYNDDAFNTIKNKIKGKDVTLDKFKENGLIIVETAGINNKTEGFSDIAYDVNVGEKVDITFANFNKGVDINSNRTEEELKKAKDGYKSYQMNIIGTVATETLLDRMSYEKNITEFIISERFLEKNMEDIVGTYNSNVYGIVSTDMKSLYFNLDGNKDKEKILGKIEEEIYKKYGATVYNIDNDLKEIKHAIKLGKIIAYGFLTIVTVILLVVILVNKNISVNTRKKEFGTMLALGMDKKSLKKSIVLEGVLQWIIITIISTPIAIKISKLSTLIYIRQGTILPESNLPLLIITTVILTLVIILITNIIPFRKFKKLDMVEMMKVEE